MRGYANGVEQFCLEQKGLQVNYNAFLTFINHSNIESYFPNIYIQIFAKKNHSPSAWNLHLLKKSEEKSMALKWRSLQRDISPFDTVYFDAICKPTPITRHLPFDRKFNSSATSHSTLSASRSSFLGKLSKSRPRRNRVARRQLVPIDLSIGHEPRLAAAPL